MVASWKFDIKSDRVLAQTKAFHRADQFEHLHDVRVLHAELLELRTRTLVQKLQRFLAKLLESGHCEMEIIGVAHDHAEDALVG